MMLDYPYNLHSFFLHFDFVFVNRRIFNTVDPLELRTKIENLSGPVRVIVPEIGIAYCFSNYYANL